MLPIRQGKYLYNLNIFCLSRVTHYGFSVTYLCSPLTYFTDANGLAIDHKARKMYFSHEGMALERANLDGTGRVTIVRELATSAFFVFLDPVGQ